MELVVFTHSWFAVLVSQGRAPNNDRSSEHQHPEQRPRVIILAGAGSYRCAPFRIAAERIGIELIEAADIPTPLRDQWACDLAVDYNDIDGAADTVARTAGQVRASAILALDDSGTLVASHASDRAGLPHNAPGASLAARDKLVMRERLQSDGAPTPWFIPRLMDADLDEILPQVTYPCVVKPTRLSGSRGVIRANNADELRAALARVRHLLQTEQADESLPQILIEEYLPGEEVAVEAIMSDGQLTVLAIFDKPDPLTGPYFEETIYLTPSRHPVALQQRIHERTAEAARAIGIRQGPVHAELRLHEDNAWIIEIAGRSIGGLCSTILEFGSGQTLEELILRNAIGEPIDGSEFAGEAAGVMMIPIPASGVLKQIDGIEAARSVPGITGIEITARIHAPIQALPEGSAYLGFIFARGQTPAEVESQLRAAHSLLDIRIDTLLPMLRVS